MVLKRRDELAEKSLRDSRVTWPYITVINISGDYYLLQRCRDYRIRAPFIVRRFLITLVELVNHLPLRTYV